ncbi:hypothetical protein EKK58_00595 [Candidatus Dependentiae bacterium]|nr:MAG: hypothetical protein EKK58_00595 [Candidatus Dependentiae bacterium]
MHNLEKDLNRPERLALMKLAVEAAARSPWVAPAEEPAPPRVEDFDPGTAELFRQIANREHPTIKSLFFTSSGVRITRKPVRVAQTVGRNAPCPCGSGKKFKKCCG